MHQTSCECYRERVVFGESSKEARVELAVDVYKNKTNQIEVQDDGDEEEENEHVKIFEEDVNNSPYENKETEGGDEIDYVSIDLIFIIF
jgi:hypothetical protein